MKSWRLHITPISPLHIGCGEEYEPVDYLVDEDRNCLQLVDSERLKMPETQRRQLADVLFRTDSNASRDRANLLSQLVGQSPDAVTLEIPIAAGALDLVFGARRNPSAKNFLRRTAFDRVNGGCLVPGSSVKGAIRTAVLASQSRQPAKNGVLATTRRNIQQLTSEARARFEQGRGGPQRVPKKDAAENEQLAGQLLELSPDKEAAMPSDPFRLVHVADASVNWQRVICIQDFRYRPDGREKANGNLASIVEVVRWQRHAPAEVLLTLPANPRDTLQRPNLGPSDGVPKISLPLERLARDCNAYYKEALGRELALGAVYSCVEPNWRKMAEEILATLPAVGDRAFLLRVGRHSGADCVTIDGVRSIKILRNGGSDFADYESSPHGIWFCADSLRQRTGLLPFGWVLVETQGPVPELRAILEQHMPAPLRVEPMRVGGNPAGAPGPMGHTPQPAGPNHGAPTTNFGVEPATPLGKETYRLLDKFRRQAETGKRVNTQRDSSFRDVANNLAAKLPKASQEERDYAVAVLRHFGPLVLDDANWQTVLAKLPKQ